MLEQNMLVWVRKQMSAWKIYLRAFTYYLPEVCNMKLLSLVMRLLAGMYGCECKPKIAWVTAASALTYAFVVACIPSLGVICRISAGFPPNNDENGRSSICGNHTFTRSWLGECMHAHTESWRCSRLSHAKEAVFTFSDHCFLAACMFSSLMSNLGSSRCRFSGLTETDHRHDWVCRNTGTLVSRRVFRA